MYLLLKVSAKLTDDGLATNGQEVIGTLKGKSNQRSLLVEILAEDFLRGVKRNEESGIHRQGPGLYFVPEGHAKVAQS